ncbi:MAG TPA: hypothetical protein ENK82_07595 [Campylobacterales bacterium]|nr:hypothetical protein [Campylobacterales bacterium]
MGILYPEQVEYVDVEEMQQTHEDEISILNAIDKLATEYERDASKKPELEVKLDEYIEHVQTHFANEERLMEKYDFYAFEMHKMAHDMFIIDLNYAIKQWKEFGDIERMTTFVRKSPEWIIMHINTMDVATARHIALAMEAEKEESN